MFSSSWAVCSGLLAFGLSILPSEGAVLSIGHRGYSVVAPENTVASFRAALPYADMVELDGQPSSDGVLMVMHDGTVDRTTDGTGTLSSMTVAQLKLLDAGSWFSSAFIGERVPLLTEALTNILPHAVPLIERKSGSPEAYVSALQGLGMVTNVVLQSFDWPFLAAVHALEPNLPLAALGSGTFTLANLASITNAGARTVAWDTSGVNSNMIQMAHDSGLKVFVWTVDGPVIQTYIDMGVDGIISNDPRLVREFQTSNTNTNVGSFAAGLVSYWRMDDGQTNVMATLVRDSKGANPERLTRADGLSHWHGAGTAMFDGCLQLDGTNSFVTVTNSASLDIGTNEMTFAAWVSIKTLPSQLATSYGAVFDSTNDCYVVYLDKANKELRFKVTDASAHAARPGIPEAALVTNQWMHIVATYSGKASTNSGQAAIYLNGQIRDSHVGNDSTSPIGLTGNVKTGQTAAMGREGPVGGNYFSGFIDDVAIWKRALTAGEVLALYQAGQSGRALRDLLATPSPKILVKSVRNLPDQAKLELDFQNLGSYQNFRLLYGTDLTGPFKAVPGLTPTPLGSGLYRFTCPLPATDLGYFRVEAE